MQTGRRLSVLLEVVRSGYIGVVRAAPCTVGAYVFAWGAPAQAQDLAPLNNMLTEVSDALTGPTGRAFGVIAIAVVGLMFATGRMHWQFALSVVLGLVILFGAESILDGIGAGTTD